MKDLKLDFILDVNCLVSVRVCKFYEVLIKSEKGRVSHHCDHSVVDFFVPPCFFLLALEGLKNGKERSAVNNYLKTLSAWIICGAIRAGFSFNSILRWLPNITLSSGFAPLSVHFGLFKKKIQKIWLYLIGKTKTKVN